MAGTLGCAVSTCNRGFLLSKTMGKRSAFFLAILLVASIVQVRLPVAAAQMSDESDSGCPSGITSPVDGSCVGSDQSQSMTMDQQTRPNPTQPALDTPARVSPSLKINFYNNILDFRIPGDERQDTYLQ